MADLAEQLKCTQYTVLHSRYHFVLVGIETSGVFGPSASSFLLELGRCLKLSTMEPEALQLFVSETFSGDPKIQFDNHFRDLWCK